MPPTTEAPPKETKPTTPPPAKETKETPKAEKPAEKKPDAKPEGDETPFIARMYQTKKKVEEKPKEEKPKAEDEPPKKEDDGKDKTPKPEKTKPVAAKKPVAPPAPALDPEEFGTAAGKAFKRAIEPESPKPKSEEPEAGLTYGERRDLAVIKRLEKSDAYKGKGLSQKFLESFKKSDEYESKWLADNPGKEFDPEADEHEAFFKSIDVVNKIDEDDWEEAKDALVRDEAKAEAKKELKGEIEPIAKRQKLIDEMPHINSSRVEAAVTFFTGMGEDFKEVLGKGGQINFEAIDKLNQAEPLNATVFEAAQRTEVFAEQLHRLVRGLPELEGAPGTPHVSPDQVDKFIAEQEQLFASLPAAPFEEGGHIDPQGRRFATAEDYNAMSPERRKGYWRFSENQLRRMYAAEQAEIAKTKLEAKNAEFERIAKARGYGKTEAEKKEEAAPKPKEERLVPDAPPGAIAPRAAHLSPQNGGANGSEKSGIAGFYGKRT